VGDPVRLIVCLALFGGTLGFLPLNRHPARIFMGDAGSMLLGFIAGTVMILFTERMGRWSVGAIIIFGLPILDTAVALVRRFINKRPLFISDRGHIYDQFMDRGLSLKRTVGLSYLLATVYAIIGLAMAQIRFRYALVVFVLVVAISGYVVWRKGFLRMPPLDKQNT
jgi:UDP-GlcNAc:undecaprenyl-phosphate/decaprenyl-phosphate GlcNAc-1-phosphate transferase